MNTEFFARQIDRLKDAFGVKQYSQERVRVLYRSLKDVPDHVFEQATTEAIGSCRFFPLLPELKEIISNVKERGPQLRIIAAVPQTNCRKCGGDGYLRVPNEAGYQILNRCHCDMGLSRPNKLVWPDGETRSIPLAPMGI